MMDVSALPEEYRVILQKAFRALKASQQHYESGDYDFASSRAYYAAFYAVEAVLLTQNRSFSKHAAVLSAFSQYFVKTGMFPKEFGTLLSRLFRERQIGDYDFDVNGIMAADAQKDVDIARTIVERVGTFLTDQFCPKAPTNEDMDKTISPEK